MSPQPSSVQSSSVEAGPTKADHAEYVLIGGGLASATAAKAIRERDPGGRIVILSAESNVPYHRPPLSKEFLRGDSDFTEAQISPKEEYTTQNIELRLGVRATGLDLPTKTITLDSGETLSFDKLCIATGASAKPLDSAQTPGAGAPNVLTLRTREDSETLRGHLQPGARAVVIGAGYIGMEAAAVCRQKGLEVTIVDTNEHPWSKNTSAAFGGFLRRYFEAQGVRFLLKDGVTEIALDRSGKATGVKTKSGETVPCDFVVAGVGAKLNLDLPKAAGLLTDDQEGVSVDAFLETASADIYAAGDIARFQDPVLEKTWHVEHWQNAEWHGQIVGANMAAKFPSERVAYDHLPYFFSDEFDLHMTLRGDPQAGKSSFVIGSMGTDTERFTEVYLRPDGTIAMGIVLSKAEDETAASDLLERLIRARALVAPHQSALQAGQMKLEDLR
ncbi:MAG: NAD(P)/FAD-dependent oxidoreductase [Cytophagales bacterium]|nr:NAD(P)/FAD-dependent oxidoreductase [Armatimonadota bacterium]